MRYFILGNHPTLSIAEIAAVFSETTDFSTSSKEAALIEAASDSARVHRLGGIVKSGEIIAETTLAELDDLKEILTNSIESSAKEGRAVFGLSVHSLAQGAPMKPAVEKANKLALSVKKALIADGKSARYVASKTPALPSVAILTNHLLSAGGEYVLLVANNRVLLGQTDAVQDFSAWSKRDYGRPRRDARSGMLPPKLARIMINLTGATPASSTLLDPFCGSGTVLMEAGLMGYAGIFGSDISEKAIADARVNTQWAESSLGAPMTAPNISVHDARAIHELIQKPVDVVVTETYLGPPIQKPGQSLTPRAHEDLLSLYRESFASIFKVLKPGGVAVVAFPCWRTVNGTFSHLPLKKHLEQVGFNVQEPLPATTPASLAVRTPSGGLLYARPDAAVGREILILRRP